MKFVLGEIVTTSGVVDKMVQDRAFGDFVSKSFNRYVKCDWGELDELDSKSNTEALNKQERIFGAYTNDKGEKIWIITEWDRSVTTILFPHEY